MYANIDGLVSWLKCEIGMCEAYANGAISTETRHSEERKKRLYEDVLEKVKWLPEFKEAHNEHGE